MCTDTVGTLIRNFLPLVSILLCQIRHDDSEHGKGADRYGNDNQQKCRYKYLNDQERIPGATDKLIIRRKVVDDFRELGDTEQKEQCRPHNEFRMEIEHAEKNHARRIFSRVMIDVFFHEPLLLMHSETKCREAFHHQTHI